MLAERRKKFGEVLREVLGSDNVYYQPPRKFKMEYPCIVYERSRLDPLWANNAPYTLFYGYSVTFITKDPDSDVVEKLARLPYSDFNKPYIADNLYHYTYTIYY